MKYYPPPFSLPPRWRWIFWPIVTVSGCGTAVALLEREAIAVVECAPVAALSGLAALLYWFNHVIFAATKPRREDVNNHSKTEG